MKPIESKFSFNFEYNPNEKTTMYTYAKADYGDFLKKIEKSDLKNGHTRFITEHSFLKRMLKYAVEDNRVDEIKKIKARLQEVNDELEKRGIKLK